MRWRWAELLDNVGSASRMRRASGRWRRSASTAGRWTTGCWTRTAGCCPIRTQLSQPPRTERWRRVARSLGEVELYRRTGIQLMPINTIFQLAAHDPGELARARRLVMLPELVAHALTGEVAAERSNAGTTGLLEVATGDWADDLARRDRSRPGILPTPETAGRLLGEHDGTPVHLVAAHDTACAFVASPLDNSGQRVRLRRYLVPRRRRTRHGGHVGGLARGELLERARRYGWLSLPQERHGLLAARAVRRVVGNDGAGAARARLAGARGAGIRRARRAVPRARADGRRGARSGWARSRRVPGRRREVDRRVGRGSGRRRRGRASANPAGRRARGRRGGAASSFVRERLAARTGVRSSPERRRPPPSGTPYSGNRAGAVRRPRVRSAMGPAVRRTRRPSRGVPPGRASLYGT